MQPAPFLPSSHPKRCYYITHIQSPLLSHSAAKRPPSSLSHLLQCSEPRPEVAVTKITAGPTKGSRNFFRGACTHDCDSQAADSDVSSQTWCQARTCVCPGIGSQRKMPGPPMALVWTSVFTVVLGHHPLNVNSRATSARFQLCRPPAASP
jgi:hypothetical protein